VRIRLHPGGPGSGYTFENTISGGAIPAAFIQPVDEGIREALAHGVLEGHPMDDVRVELYDGSYHDGDSSAAAFRIAGAMAFREAASRAGPVVLEPVMQVEVLVPGDHVADAMSLLSRRRGQIRSQEQRAGAHVIKAHVPLAEMFGYATDLRLRTRGRAATTVQLAGYHVRPGKPDAGDDDWTSSVTAPRMPPLKGKHTGIALPEPEVDA
jgi:elongation factor G